VSDGTRQGGKIGGGGLGDYTGLAFVDGTVHMTWTDNSNSTKDNPDGTLSRADVYYDRIDVNAKTEVTASTPPAARSTTGIGISVALNLPFLTTEATIGRAHVTADGVIVDVDPGQHFSAQTTSGSSGMDTGVAGSLAINVGISNVHATIAPNATVTIASGGAAGKTAVTPVVAIAVAHNETVATLGKLTDDTTGDPQALVISGSYKASATHEGTVKTVAEGDTKSGDTGVGISLALTIASDSAVATTGRDITAGGAVTFTARSVAADSALAKASSAGGLDTPTAASDGKDQG